MGFGFIAMDLTKCSKEGRKKLIAEFIKNSKSLKKGVLSPSSEDRFRFGLANPKIGCLIYTSSLKLKFNRGETVKFRTLEEWKNGRMEEWKNGRMVDDSFMRRIE